MLGDKIKTGRRHAFRKTGGRVRPPTVLAFASAAQAEPYHLRIGWVVAPADLSTIMFLKPELAPHAGKSYIPDLIHFAGTPAEMQALATGDLDTAALAFSTFALGVVNAGMDDLRILGDEFQDGVPGYHTNDFMVRNDSGIKTVEDLKGKVLATNQVGSAVDMALLAMLAKHKMQDKKDVTIIEARVPDQMAMLTDKKIDLTSSPAPFGFDPEELTAFAHPLFHQADAMGRSQMIVRVARTTFLDNHRDATVDFLEDYVHALRYLLDPAHHDEAVKLAAQATKQRPELYPGLVLYQERLLPRFGRPAQSRGAAEERRYAAGARLSAQEDRRVEIHRSQPRQGGGTEAGEIAGQRVSIAGMEEIYTFGGNPLDRASGRRTDKTWIQGLLDDPETRILPMRGLKPLLREGNEPALNWQPIALWRGVIDAGATLIFLGLNDERALFALDATGADVLPDWDAEAVDVGTLAPQIAVGEAAILAEARALIDWHVRHGFAPNAAPRPGSTRAGWRRRCRNAGRSTIRVPTPATIVLTVRGEYGLLGAQQAPPRLRASPALPGFWSPARRRRNACGARSWRRRGSRSGGSNTWRRNRGRFRRR